MTTSPEKSDLLLRIEQRLQTLGMSARQASMEAVGNPEFIRNIRKGLSQSPRGTNILKLAKVLQVSESWLMGVSDDLEEHPQSTPFGVRFGGIVEAGNFRPDDGLNQANELRRIAIPHDPRFPREAQYAFEVRGDSMNGAHIEDGMWVLAVDVMAWERLHGAVPSGKPVVVAQTRNGEPERELTVKRLQYFRDRMVLQPESTNPIHKPLEFPLPLGHDALRDVAIIAVVLQSLWIHA